MAPSPLCWGAWHAATLCKHQAPPVALLLALPNLLFWGGPDGCGCCCVTVRAAKSPRCCLEGPGGSVAVGMGLCCDFCRVGACSFSWQGHRGCSPFLGSSAPLGLHPAPFGFSTQWPWLGRGLALLGREKTAQFVPIPCAAVGAGVCPTSLGTPAGEGPVSPSWITSLSIHPPHGHRACKHILLPAENTGS